MSKRNNMNPDHYVGRGRDRNSNRDRPSDSEAAVRYGIARLTGVAPNFIPGAAPVGEPGERKNPQQ